MQKCYEWYITSFLDYALYFQKKCEAEKAKAEIQIQKENENNDLQIQ